jgi:hypothetical protein
VVERSIALIDKNFGGDRGIECIATGALDT